MDWSWLNTGEFYSMAAALVWAMAVILFRKGGETISPLGMNLFKNTIGLILLLITIPIAGLSLSNPDATPGQWLALLMSGAIGICVADTLFFASLNRLGAGRSAMLDCMYGPCVVFFSFIYLKEPLGLTIIISLALMGGAIFIGTAEKSRGLITEDSRQVRLGIILGILSLFLMAAAVVAVKPVLEQHNPLWSTTVRMLGGMGFLLLQSSLRRNHVHVRSAFRPSRVWLITIPAGILGAYLSMTLWITGMAMTTATTASILNQLSTIFIFVLGTIFLKEPITLRRATAIAMGFTGALLLFL